MWKPKPGSRRTSKAAAGRTLIYGRRSAAEFPRAAAFWCWGVGAHTLRLLATGGLEIEWVEAFVDSNRKYQQRNLRGAPVISPEQLRSRTEPILISSRGFQTEIHHQIRDHLGLTNPVILLYDGV